MRFIFALALSLSVFGCGGGCSGAGDERSSERSGQAGANGREASGGEGAASDPEEPPVLQIVTTLDRHTRSVGLRIENRGTDQASVRGRVTVQRRQRGDWEDYDSNVDLRFDCDARAPDCATLAPGAVLIPPPWLGKRGDAQCACDRCADAPAGVYRFVARSCGGTHAIEGEPFDLP